MLFLRIHVSIHILSILPNRWDLQTLSKMVTTYSILHCENDWEVFHLRLISSFRHCGCWICLLSFPPASILVNLLLFLSTCCSEGILFTRTILFWLESKSLPHKSMTLLCNTIKHALWEPGVHFYLPLLSQYSALRCSYLSLEESEATMPCYIIQLVHFRILSRTHSESSPDKREIEMQWEKSSRDLSGLQRGLRSWWLPVPTSDRVNPEKSPSCYLYASSCNQKTPPDFYPLFLFYLICFLKHSVEVRYLRRF